MIRIRKSRNDDSLAMMNDMLGFRSCEVISLLSWMTLCELHKKKAYKRLRFVQH